MKYPVYFDVSGKRAFADEAGKRQETPPVLRYQTLFLHDAQSYATKVYRNEKVLLVIDEVSK